jgi:hypothetical protein
MEVDPRYGNNRLRYHRTILKYRLQDVAYLLGHARQDLVGRWERGICLPKGSDLLKLCLIFRTLPHDLYPDLTDSLKREITERERSLFPQLSDPE